MRALMFLLKLRIAITINNNYYILDISNIHDIHAPPTQP